MLNLYRDDVMSCWMYSINTAEAYGVTAAGKEQLRLFSDADRKQEIGGASMNQ